MPRPRGRSANVKRRSSSVLRITYETRIQTRWPDFDGLGHLNHTAYHVFLDEARDDVLRRTVGDFTAWPNVVAHTSLDYRSEVAVGTREVIVESEITAVGRSSVRFRQRLVRPDGTVAAEGETVLVAWDRASRRPRAIGEAERAALRR
jgi:acyl-CoA thioester hydrolase